jgi:hypothetical protein
LGDKQTFLHEINEGIISLKWEILDKCSRGILINNNWYDVIANVGVWTAALAQKCQTMMHPLRKTATLSAHSPEAKYTTIGVKCSFLLLHNAYSKRQWTEDDLESRSILSAGITL